MELAARNLEFKQAATLKDTITTLHRLSKKTFKLLFACPNLPFFT
ncbi:MAG TPA: hypothetical protein DDW41_04450 [Candidatus Andersenbacteria bacterium]|nr:hypothetical protein [Candidatus Andersenbacteria bacterium]